MNKLLSSIGTFSKYIPTKLNQSKLTYVLLTYLEIPLTCLFPYIHGHNLRATIDFILGIFITFLANGNWTYLLLLESILGYMYGNLPKWRPKIRGVKLDVRTGVGTLICVILVRYLVNLYVDSTIFLNDSTIREFTPNTVMVMAIKIGHLCRRDDNCKVDFSDWLAYCFTLNGSLSGMAVELTDWYEWINEKYLDEKKKSRVEAFKRAIMATIQATLCSIVNLMLYEPAFRSVETMEIFSYNRYTSLLGIRSKMTICLFNILSLMVLAFAHRCMYYVVWLCFWAQLCGSQFAFGPNEELSGEKNRKYSYSREKNINVKKVENCITMVELVANWNILAAKYWRSTIFVPAVDMGFSHGFSMFLTNTASALWHGGRCNMLTFFWLSTLMMLCAKFGWKYVRPRYVTSATEAKKRIKYKNENKLRQSLKDYWYILRANLYERICHIWTKILLAGIEQTYVSPTYKDVYKYMKQICFYPVWLPMLLAGFNIMLGTFSPKFREYNQMQYNEKQVKVAEGTRK